MHIRPQAIGIVIALAMLSNVRAAEPIEIRIETGPGLKYDTTRFVVEPGAAVRLIIHNVDEMQHNLVITEPGARMDIVNAALAMGVDGLKRQYVPDSPKVLWATRLLDAEQTVTLEFTAPTEPGVYPYVCTFPGHGILMYGAMYVGRDVKLPPLSEDEHVPPPLDAAASAAHMQHDPMDDRPHVQRTFMPDCGPAAIAVDLGGGRSYCFDAGACRLRYAWTGGFIDPSRHLAGNGDAFADVIGRIWYRAGDTFPLRIGTDDGPQSVEFLGYRLVDRVPVFAYRVNGVTVRERLALSPSGEGLMRHFEIEPTKQPVRFLAEPHTGAVFSAAQRVFFHDTLSIHAGAGARFTVVMSPQPPGSSEALPLKYVSCNDTLWTGKPLPVDGVVGRALPFRGTEKKPQQVDTGLDAAALADGGTIMAWVRPDKPRDGLQTILGAAQGDDLFGLFIEDKQLRFKAADDEVNAAMRQSSGAWHHIAATLDGDRVAIYINGDQRTSKTIKSSPAGGRLFIGGVDKQHPLRAKLDEVRIDDRAWSAAEIAAIYRQEARR